MKFDLKALSHKELDEHQNDVEHEVNRRLVERLTNGTKVITLRAGFGGGPEVIRYVIGHVYPGDVIPGYKTFEGTKWESVVPDGKWDVEYIILGKAKIKTPTYAAGVEHIFLSPQMLGIL